MRRDKAIQGSRHASLCVSGTGRFRRRRWSIVCFDATVYTWHLSIYRYSLANL